MRRTVMPLLTRVIACVAACLPAMAWADGPQLKLPAFDHLQRVATHAVNISIGARPLRIAARLLDDNDPQDAEFQQLLRGLQAIHIRSYEFASDNMYSTADVDAVRKQLSSPGWNPLAQLRGHRDDERIDVYVCTTHQRVSGLAVVASGRREFTIVNVVGSIEPQKLATLADRFGLPQLAR
jgi:hypothetical protein